MKINIVGAVQDIMGYGEFARNFAVALHDIGENIRVTPVSFEREKTDHGRAGQVCKELAQKTFKPTVNIVNFIPRLFHGYRVPGCFNIGFTMFETTKIPDSWVAQCNTMDAILVPSDWNKEVFLNSGVKVPIGVAPPGITVPELPKKSQNEKFRFYSVFQWTPRKHPLGLLKAYWAEFSGNTDVELILKTYRKAPIRTEQALILQEIAALKKEFKLPHYPKIQIIGEMLTKEQMADLHSSGDCFVLPHRAEGIGLPHMEAMSYGNPVIATGYSGNMEFMNNENSFLLDYTLTPVSNMEWFQPNLYHGDMMWAEPDLANLMSDMRYVYENREEASGLGVAGRDHLLENFSWEKKAKNLVAEVDRLMREAK